MGRYQTRFLKNGILVKVLPLIIILVIVLALFYVLDIKVVSDWVISLQRHPLHAAAAIIALYLLASIFLLPGSIILTCASGMIFGFWLGLLVIWIGAALGIVAVLFLSRLGPQKWITAFVSRHSLFVAVDREVRDLGWKAVILLRLVPVIPTRIVNYLLVLTSIDWKTYLWSSVLGVLPLKAVYVYLGTLFSSLADIDNIQQTRGVLVAEILGLAAFTIAIVIFSRRIRARMTRAEQPHRSW